VKLSLFPKRFISIGIIGITNKRMDDATAARHRNAAKKRKDEKKRKVLVKELNDGRVSTTRDFRRNLN
jgi:hypothetical protein